MVKLLRSLPLRADDLRVVHDVYNRQPGICERRPVLERLSECDLIRSKVYHRRYYSELSVSQEIDCRFM